MAAPSEPVLPNALVSLRLVELVNAADPCALGKVDISLVDPNSQLSITMDFSGTTLDIVTFVVLVVLVDMSVTPCLYRFYR